MRHPAMRANLASVINRSAYLETVPKYIREAFGGTVRPCLQRAFASHGDNVVFVIFSSC